ncbi:MAG: ATP-binding protein [Ignavibacteriales bacterium]|nr:MAG: ATP-binding protein [Ignavibacteriaceae bacterium]MBW7873525.1 ATP-binding protein [Ignavibacteria bacterium]MCZ2142216.1 ATP-binding protein [Ignavibacteriales bacterium]OQY76100.1 MAG: hypothetical protein B6D45_04575 [Ignavibacteriales bacterium UTCHB3]MBV6444950.1 hypothetical protein [Ignavibacteriaceae bacterium]
MIKRAILSKILERMFKGKLIIIYGARQTGKTTLLREVQKKYKNSIWLNCDEPDVRAQLENATSSALKRLIGNARVVFIDEAQRVLNIGLTLKIMYEMGGNYQIVATGSSSFDLSNKISEPLTGRYFSYKLYPLSTGEILSDTGYLEYNRLFSDLLIYGHYPDIVNSSQDREQLLIFLTSSYMYKDIFTFQDIRRTDIIEKLLRVLALQVGGEVSINELSSLIGADRGTISRYISLLESTFIIFGLGALTGNQRKEISKMKKIYFYDNGIRNALISNFKPLELRSDIGQLWENFVISERIKYNQNMGRYPNKYFWRTRSGSEVDYIEEMNGKLEGFEIKYGANAKIRGGGKAFLSSYPGSDLHLINRENHLNYLSENVD